MTVRAFLFNSFLQIVIRLGQYLKFAHKCSFTKYSNKDFEKKNRLHFMG